MFSSYLSSIFRNMFRNIFGNFFIFKNIDNWWSIEVNEFTILSSLLVFFIFYFFFLFFCFHFFLYASFFIGQFTTGMATLIQKQQQQTSSSLQQLPSRCQIKLLRQKYCAFHKLSSIIALFFFQVSTFQFCFILWFI